MAVDTFEVRIQIVWPFDDNFKIANCSLSKTDAGGFTEAQASIKGDNVFKMLKFESGVHRVQRIPFNDTKMQTSAASVFVLPGEIIIYWTIIYLSKNCDATV